MLKAIVNKETGINIEIEGSVMDTVQDVAALIRTVYSALYEQDPIAGKSFRAIIMEALNDNNCCIWELDDSKPSIMVDLTELVKQLREE